MDIAKEKSASDLTDRCKGAIWGQFIGDAACARLKKTQGAPGLDEPAQGAAANEKGSLTHYGEAALLMLQSVADLGYFSAPDFGPRFMSYFSSELYQGHLDQSTQGTLENYRRYREQRPGASYHFQGGADGDEAGAATRLAPVVVNLCLQGSLQKVVESATRVTQNNERAVLYTRCHALITRQLLTGTPLREAVKTAGNKVAVEGELGKELSIAIESVFGMLDKDVREATRQFGTGSSLKSAFPAALHCALKHENDLGKALAETATAGGDCAARAALVGTWLGGLHGMEAIPAQWRDELSGKNQIERCVEKIVAKSAK